MACRIASKSTIIRRDLPCKPGSQHRHDGSKSRTHLKPGQYSCPQAAGASRGAHIRSPAALPGRSQQLSMATVVPSSRALALFSLALLEEETVAVIS